MLLEDHIQIIEVVEAWAQVAVGDIPMAVEGVAVAVAVAEVVHTRMVANIMTSLVIITPGVTIIGEGGAGVLVATTTKLDMLPQILEICWFKGLFLFLFSFYFRKEG